MISTSITVCLRSAACLAIDSCDKGLGFMVQGSGVLDFFDPALYCALLQIAPAGPTPLW